MSNQTEVKVCTAKFRDGSTYTFTFESTLKLTDQAIESRAENDVHNTSGVESLTVKPCRRVKARRMADRA